MTLKNQDIHTNPNNGEERWYFDKLQDKIVNLCYALENSCDHQSNNWCQFCNRHYCGQHFLLHECFKKYGLTKVYIIRDTIDGSDNGICLNYGAANDEIKRLRDLWDYSADYFYIYEEYARTR
jgi:hypothetical protein